MFGILVTLGLALTAVNAQYFGSYYCQPGRDVIVHLFEWKWTDIERECQWLADHNYCGVQVSPPNEHRIVTDPPYPWWQRYQPVSYTMNSRSGSETQFRNMVTTCNNLGVYIYVDGVLNHMTGGGSGTGSDGNSFDGDSLQYPGVPYGPNDFHGSDDCSTSDGEIHDYNNPTEVRNCRLSGLRDLDGSANYVRDVEAEFANRLIGWGVAGFRLDACKHMWPGDLEAILGRLNQLNTQWFPAGRNAYIYQEVIDLGGEAVKATEYTYLGRVTEFKHGQNLGNVVRKNNGQRLANLVNFGEGWGQLSGFDALVFIDNHDNQRGHGAGGFGTILTFFEANMYKIATAFELAWDYGHVRLMSSYNWPRNIVNGVDTNDWVGPPTNGGGDTKDVECFNGEWICEHRWREMYNMVRFHNVAIGNPVSNWWDNGFQAIAFGRGNRGFIFINNEDFAITQTLQTGLPGGEYCDVISCDNNRPPCGNSGGACRATVIVNGDGTATFDVPNGENPMIAIHV
uniref:alpha-amylase n=1 Tax=Eisenia fetida TaxID=6396 RepID=A0A173N065_EISFE|nr:alpha-amylase [Eisenia fetida]